MSIAQNLATIKQKIEQVENQANRPQNSVKLLAVTKTKPVTAIEQAIEAGQRCFGENYVQEGIEKVQYFAGNDQLEWHFIGALQSNKTRPVATHFDWVQTVDRFKIAQRLSEQRPDDLPPLNVLIQINISDENSKSGIAPEEMFALAEQIADLPRLTLRGLMAIPKPESEPEAQRVALSQMAILFEQLKEKYTSVDILSMGMSDDLVSAIECGSTMVRIGTAIFGARD
ncbi:YggS family pyridoxal phosphate-dependent enzyme [Otariodibacter oris]|uniref:Pyridoxal phosphate homeostasis protein n=1 Tax=Otariodibacter oris TaxID=1032623 RepID=A0A420XJQ5_9PAST|nr:YggS family pyridoxal phosphate-dependent enzyme [Otariodibacter oris]QGM80386.1 YggS family pyridoxal phosphate enzyme [Otariodibacter oris]RKR77473.1 hypothetical protein DES31_0803 [Otariodibacter oris]